MLKKAYNIFDNNRQIKQWETNKDSGVAANFCEHAKIWEMII